MGPSYASESRPTPSGWLAAICGLLLGASALRSLRIEIGGLLVHPVSIMVGIMLVTITIPRLRELPSRIILPLLVFGGMFALTALIEPGGLSVTVKLLASIATLLVLAVAIRNDADYKLAAVSMLFGVALVGARGLLVSDATVYESVGINPFEGIANKNGFSLFALPALMLGGHVAIRSDTSMKTRWILAFAILVTVLAIFSTGNRSGWLGCVVVGLILLMSGLRGNRIVLLLTIIAAAIYLVYAFGNPIMFEHRIERTLDPAQAFNRRLSLISAALAVGRENPLLGASPQGIHIEMARLTGVREHIFDTHNAFALLFGGGGLSVLIPFLLLGFSMWHRPSDMRLYGTDSAFDAHFVLRAMIVLWCLRGLFTAEILYNPAFSIAIGIAVGRCMLHGVWQPHLTQAESPRRSTAPLVRTATM